MSGWTRFLSCISTSFLTMVMGFPLLVRAQCDAIVITKQPSASVICAGATTTFSVSATGTGLNYQWREWGADMPEGGLFSGTKTATLTIKNAPGTLNNNAYSVIVSSNCTFAQSNDAILTVKTPPVITSQPSDNSGCLGGKAVFGVVATGELLNYQWKANGNDITNSTSYAGANTATLTLNTVASTMQGNVYSVVISNGCAPQAVSNNVNFSITPTVTPTISISTSSPTTLCGGTPVTLNAEVTNGGGPPKFQWKINGANVGADASSLTTGALANGDVVTCVLTSNSQCVTSANVTSNQIGFSVTSASAAIVANPGTDLCTGAPVKFSVTPTNGGAPTYQWQINESPVPSATSTTFTSSTLKNGDQISVVMTPTGICTSARPSNVLKMNINSGPIISSQPQNKEQCLGKNVQFSVSASGQGLTYQWKKDSKSISGAVQDKLEIVDVSGLDVGTYEVEVSGLCATQPVKSNVVTLTVDSSPNCVPFGVGLEEEEIASVGTLSLYPNPFSGDRLTLILPSHVSGHLRIEILDAEGSLKIEKEVDANNGHIFVEGIGGSIQSGMYLVKVLYGGGSLKSKFIFTY